MKLRHLLTLPLVGICMVACSNASRPSTSYHVTLPLTDDDNGLMAYLTNFDTGENIDSTQVSGAQAVWEGSVEYPILARIYVDGARKGMVVLEEGDIVINKNEAKGSPLNDYLASYNAQVSDLAKKIRSLEPTDSAQQAELMAQYEQISEKALSDNANNTLGYYFLLQKAYDMDLDELDATMKQFPQFEQSQKLATLREAKVKKAETGVGSKYKDFEIAGADGTSQRLSDFVGQDGKYLLVDYWASWCGPCRKEIPYIKQLAQAHADKLNVLGVAVWDEPQNTLKAIDDLGITWPVILNAGTIPTDLYGISGIPCIMLISPDGTIVSRDQQSEELVAEVEAILAQ
ncbi:MAG: AhpC/TSA family protein [Bacteroidales bacterium]|nr:AhpC/TSA family protein [Bacteroidales bacterium]